MANVWADSGGLGPMLTNLARNAERRTRRGDSFHVRASSAAWAHLTHQRGNVGLIRDGLL